MTMAWTCPGCKTHYGPMVTKCECEKRAPDTWTSTWGNTWTCSFCKQPIYSGWAHVCNGTTGNTGTSVPSA